MDHRLARSFGKVLRELRTRKKLSQENLAFDAKMDRTFISMLERGVRQPTLETIFRLAKILEIEPWKMVKRVK